MPYLSIAKCPSKSKQIPFPSSYKDALLKGSKNTTIRIDKEIGKYKTGETYDVTSYSGQGWEIKIQIDEITKVKIKDLQSYGIPERSVSSFKKKAEGLSADDVVDLIKFRVL